MDAKRVTEALLVLGVTGPATALDVLEAAPLRLTDQEEAAVVDAVIHACGDEVGERRRKRGL